MKARNWHNRSSGLDVTGTCLVERDSGITVKQMSKSQMAMLRMKEKLSFQSKRFLNRAIKIKTLVIIPATITAPRTVNVTLFPWSEVAVKAVTVVI